MFDLLFRKIKTYNLDKLSKYSIVSSQVSEVKRTPILEQKVAEQSIVNKGIFKRRKNHRERRTVALKAFVDEIPGPDVLQ